MNQSHNQASVRKSAQGPAPSSAPSSAGEPSSRVAVGGSRRSRPRLQISLALMLLLMSVFAVISASLFYASRVPVIRQEISMLLYGEAGEGGEDVGRMAHRAFIMFTFASPLILACLLSLGVSVAQSLQRRSP
jgi:hypothetical protein